MSIQDWLGLILTSLSILALVAGAVKWYIKNETKPIAEAIEEIRKETKTNGGSSMRDEIKLIKNNQEHHINKQDDMDAKLNRMYDILLEYISKSK